MAKCARPTLRDTLKLTQAEFRRRVTVETDLGELPEIYCFPQMLNQVFLNLLVNAGQAIECTGTITVRTRFEGGAVHISIADTGRGMTAEQQARVFEAGYTTKPVGEGTGLGLSIAREIVEGKHGGSGRSGSRARRARARPSTSRFRRAPVSAPKRRRAWRIETDSRPS
jgi:signal transduction histidine kinase